MTTKLTHLFSVLLLTLSVTVQATEPAESLYQWQPVRLGAGGFVTGFVTHPLDAAVRYCRTDVGNAYRWNGTEWLPMVVSENGQGMPANLAATPAACGVDSIAVDPANKRIVYLAMKGDRPDSIAKGLEPLGGNVYKSIDGGATFTAGNLSLKMEPNGRWRTYGERLKVDPNNAEVVYYGSLDAGLWRSADGGKTWQPAKGEGVLGEKSNLLAIHFVAHAGTTKTGLKRSREIFVVGAEGSVYQSSDGGVSWKNVSANTELDGKCEFSTIDGDDTLHVVAKGLPDVWSWRDGRWQPIRVVMDWNRSPSAIAFDPKNPKRIYAITSGAGLARSNDGGASWTALGPTLAFQNSLGWLPQAPGWRSNAGIYFDAAGVLWIPQGNEGMLTLKPTDTEDGAHAPQWKIDSVGIEEFVTHDVILPPGGDAVFAVEDATGLVSSDLSQFVAKQIPLQDQLISNGTGLAYCPNEPKFLAVVTADVNYTGSGKSYSGFSTDGGKTWERFATLPVDTATGKQRQPAGSIAISRRGDWTTGSDHLVWLPQGEGPTYFSHDGGKSWKPSEGFPLKNGYWIFALKQRSLVADPFTPDKYYFVGSWGGGFYVSNDGGRSWQKQEQAGLSIFNHHGQLAVNHAIKDDLWFCDGWDGANEHGLWHSTDGGAKFTKVAGIQHAITLCIGAGRGQAGDAAYAVYFYGKLTDQPWGISRSTDAGQSWMRVAYYPTGIFDQPTCMAASLDKFAKVIVGFNGNSFVYGTSN